MSLWWSISPYRVSGVVGPLLSFLSLLSTPTGRGRCSPTLSLVLRFLPVKREFFLATVDKCLCDTYKCMVTIVKLFELLCHFLWKRPDLNVFSGWVLVGAFPQLNHKGEYHQKWALVVVSCARLPSLKQRTACWINTTDGSCLYFSCTFIIMYPEGLIKPFWCCLT